MTRRKRSLELSDEVQETMMIGSLRFDGWKWLDAQQSDKELGFSPWIDPVVNTLTLHLDMEANFATCFALQRFLCKWGGEQLPESSPDHTAWRFLFLHTYAHPTPSRYVFEEYETKWQRLRREIIEQHASEVRRGLILSTGTKR